MTTVYEIPPDKMIEIIADDLKNKVKFKMPEWAKFVKTGAHRERVPQSDDWWWIRSASILRKIYINGPVGVQRLRTGYGGKKNRGVKPEKFYRAGGKIIRSILQEFDRIGFTEKADNGRKITPKGRSYLDKLATEISRKSK
ncbi:MAG: 30S ribosomal protein S19e [Candidatus Altiarchaeales archaeon ex4484_43]|nr:MAG: 30S ribosomal protein S19e [Candidatus Altiarchaeales archaeon ex4484_43]RLI89726.1 MAG: 30S ribosomal protein S19e [Candidatus Altiarchaeales archaeon]